MSHASVIQKQAKHSTIEVLQIMRVFSAMVVFLSHFFDPTEYALPGGTVFVGRVGVAFFFMISGFLLIYTDRGTAKGYFRKRIVRLVPLYYLTTFAVFAVGLVMPSFLHTSESGIVPLVKSLLFIPFYSGSGVFPLYPITWTLTAEVFVYVIYYLPMLLLKSRTLSAHMVHHKKQFKGIVTSLILITLVIVREFVPKNIFTDAYGAKYMLYFVIGILVACFWENILSAAKKCHIVISTSENCAVQTTVALIIGVLILSMSLLYRDTYPFILLMGVIFVVLLTVLWQYRFPKIIVEIGNMSYSFYLVHYFVVKLYLRIFCNSSEVTNVVFAILMAAVCYTVTTGLAYICYRVVEKWLTGILKKLLKI